MITLWAAKYLRVVEKNCILMKPRVVPIAVEKFCRASIQFNILKNKRLRRRRRKIHNGVRKLPSVSQIFLFYFLFYSSSPVSATRTLKSLFALLFRVSRPVFRAQNQSSLLSFATRDERLRSHFLTPHLPVIPSLYFRSPQKRLEYEYRQHFFTLVKHICRVAEALISLFLSLRPISLLVRSQFSPLASRSSTCFKIHSNTENSH